MPNPPMTSPAPLTAERLAELRAIAEAATPGPWQNGIDDLEGVVAPSNPGLGNVVCIPPRKNMYASLEAWPANAKHIAAFDPPTALALLADRERLEARAQAAEAKLAERADDRGTTHGVGCWSWGPRHYACAEARIAALEEEIARRDAVRTADWGDEKDQWSAEISAAHPVQTKRHDLYVVAMQMVGTRRSKYSLVDLVNWLLSRIEKADARTALAARDGGEG